MIRYCCSLAGVKVKVIPVCHVVFAPVPVGVEISAYSALALSSITTICALRASAASVVVPSPRKSIEMVWLVLSSEIRLAQLWV